MYILGIESSCDETSAAVVEMAEGKRRTLSNIVASQIETHRLYGGVVPDTIEELTKLPGVGRKTANLICGDVYGVQGVVVADTHCIRICGRLGFYPEKEKNPAKIEKILDKYIEKKVQSDFCHRIVYFGRDICTARSPKCEKCPMKSFCKNSCISGKTDI